MHDFDKDWAVYGLLRSGPTSNALDKKRLSFVTRQRQMRRFRQDFKAWDGIFQREGQEPEDDTSRSTTEIRTMSWYKRLGIAALVGTSVVLAGSDVALEMGLNSPINVNEMVYDALCKVTDVGTSCDSPASVPSNGMESSTTSLVVTGAATYNFTGK